jgi:hypothetical protein
MEPQRRTVLMTLIWLIFTDKNKFLFKNQCKSVKISVICTVRRCGSNFTMNFIGYNLR